MKLLSIQVGALAGGRAVTTGIFKERHFQHQLDKVNADHERNVI